MAESGAALDPTEAKRWRVQSMPATEMKTGRTNWLLDNWLLGDELNLIAGEGGIGKSSLVCRIMVALADARDPFNGVRLERRHRTLYLQNEDPQHIVANRLVAAGRDDLGSNRDGYRYAQLMDVPCAEVSNRGDKRDISLRLGLDSLMAQWEAEEGGVDGCPHVPRVIFVDPFISLIPDDFIHAQDVRDALEPVRTRLRNLGVALVGIHHVKKDSHMLNAADAVLGSSALTQVARHVIAIRFCHPSRDRVIGVCKSNYAPEYETREYDLRNTLVETDAGPEKVGLSVIGGVEGGHIDAVYGHKRKEAADAERYRETADRMAGFLKGRGGFAPSGDFEALCAEMGSPARSGRMKAAMALAGIASKRRGGAWYKCLPNVEPDVGDGNGKEEAAEERRIYGNEVVDGLVPTQEDRRKRAQRDFTDPDSARGDGMILDPLPAGEVEDRGLQ